MTVKEIAVYTLHNGYIVALLEDMDSSVCPWIIGKGYDPMIRRWDHGTYFKDYKECVVSFITLIHESECK